MESTSIHINDPLTGWTSYTFYDLRFNKIAVYNLSFSNFRTKKLLYQSTQKPLLNDEVFVRIVTKLQGRKLVNRNAKC